MGLERVRRQAARLGLRHTEGMSPEQLIRAMQAVEGRKPCFGQDHCCASQHRCCEWRHACRAEPVPARGLILSDNVIIARQILTMLGAACGWNMTHVHKDREAYALISNGDIDVVIADINSIGLGGMSVLSYVRQRWPSIMAYAIAQHDDHFLKKLARDMGGCLGFFHRIKGRAELDTRSGVPVELLSREHTPPSPPAG